MWNCCGKPACEAILRKSGDCSGEPDWETKPQTMQQTDNQGKVINSFEYGGTCKLIQTECGKFIELKPVMLPENHKVRYEIKAKPKEENSKSKETCSPNQAKKEEKKKKIAMNPRMF